MVVYIQPELSKYTGRVIYKLIAPDKRVYIGKATTSHKRIGAHKTEAFAKKDGKWKSNSRWKRAIREFGWENLLVEILEFVPKWTSLDKRERFWIAEYHASDPKYGFNMNKGGGGVTKHTAEAKAKISAAHSKPVTCCEILEDGETHQKVKLTRYDGCRAAEADLGISNSCISRCCHGKLKSAGGYLWWFSKEDEVFGERTLPRVGDMPGSNKPVTCCEILEDGETHQKVKLTSYDGCCAAGAALGIANTSISACCLGKRKSAGGYLWWFSKEDEVFGECTLPRVGDVPGQEQAVISVLSLGDGQADEQLHASMSESGHTLSATGKKFSHGAISRCCSRERRSHQGYNFRLRTTEKREDFDKNFKRTVPYNPELYTIKKR